MSDFCTVSDLATFLQVEIATAMQIAAAQRAIREATEAIRNYCHQYISFVENDVITLDVDECRYNVLLPELPVVKVLSVVEDSTTLTPDDDYKLARAGQLVRIGRRWKTGIGILTVTYTHGYQSVPDDIAIVATRAASRAYQAGLRAAETAGVLSVVQKHLGDFSVSYGNESGGTGEGVMGASAARMLLMSEKEILNRYRVKP